LKGMDSPFRPGMTATVDIQTEVAANILAVPIAAVSTRTDTSSSSRYGKKDDNESKAEEIDYEVVFVKNGTKAKLKVVKTGIQDDENIEILSGLEDGEEIIVGPYSAVSKKLMNDVGIKESESKSESKMEDE